MKQNGCVLHYAAQELKADCEFMLKTLKQNAHARKHVAPERKADRELEGFSATVAAERAGVNPGR